jgi:membrane dipeptidase
MDDEMLMALKQNGGVIQTVAFGGYVKTDSPDRTSALGALRSEFGVAPPPAARAGGGAPAGPARCPVEGGNAPAVVRNGPALGALSPERRVQYDKRLAGIDAKWPPAGPAVKDFVDHIDYLVKLIGIDHVGISSDFDGGGGLDGWNSAAETFNVTLELVRRSYTEE